MITGLTTLQAQERLLEFGHNILPKPKPPGAAVIFLRQFLNPLIYILLAAAVVSLFLGHISDAMFIFIVLVVNATIGTIQEYSAQKAASSLQQMVPAFATVVRNGKAVRLEAEHLVPGDIVLLESGDKVPADIQLSHAQGLMIDESLLTGESVAVLKSTEKKTSDHEPISSRADMVFAGTMVARGRGQGVVTTTGYHTELGKIAKSITAPSITKPPLLLRIEKFTLRISLVVLVVIALMFFIAWWQGGNLTEMFLIAVALAVSAIPEGLPAAITVTLAIGMRRMAARNVIIRKLLAVESLGSCTFIASDKTGTLTVNELTARKIILPDGSHFDVTGEGLGEGKIVAAKSHSEMLTRLCHAALFANEAILEEGSKYKSDMVDVAFLVLGKKHGAKREMLLKQCPEVANIPYESENGYSASIHQCDKEKRIFVKGSVEKLLAMCSQMRKEKGEVPLDAAHITGQMEQLAELGYKVLALADGKVLFQNPKDNLHNLTFLGLVGMIDPLRSEAHEAVELCKNAGIEVAMITGDHPVTARAIAKDLGLCGGKARVITGKDIKEAASKGESALIQLVEGNRVFARIAPAQKQQIVQALMRLGHFVAVTGDGVNDAPALKHSHVGVAMGKRGTDVARESADLIITDDDFASIVKGVHEGRIVYANIRKVIFLLVSTGAAEIILFILSMLAGLPMPLLAVQLLWLNLVTNGIQDVALAFEPSEGDELRRPPRRPNEPIFDHLMLSRVILSGLFMGILAFGIFYWLTLQGYPVETARNMTLLLMVLLENMQALNSRSETRSIFRQQFWNNPFLLVSIVIAQGMHIATMYLTGIRDVLQIQPVSFEQWAWLLLIAAILLGLDEFYRLLSGKKFRLGLLPAGKSTP